MVGRDARERADGVFETRVNALMAWQRPYRTSGMRVRRVHACVRGMAGCTTPINSVRHAGPTVTPNLTFHMDHPVGADQRLRPHNVSMHVVELMKSGCRSVICVVFMALVF